MGRRSLGSGVAVPSAHERRAGMLFASDWGSNSVVTFIAKEEPSIMVYTKPEIVASYHTGDIIGTAVGSGSSCANSDPNNMCDMG